MTVVIATLLAYWTGGIILAALIDMNRLNDDAFAFYSMGLLFPVVYVLLYPARAWHRYSQREGYYKKHGISRFQYIVLHKRVKPDK